MQPSRGADRLSSSFDALVAGKLAREKAQEQAKWVKMTTEERLLTVESLQKEELVAVFSHGYDDLISSLSERQRLERSLQAPDDIWQATRLTDGKLLVVESERPHATMPASTW
ncbi:MAG: hypothetical protein M1838_002272 [Thelocarpon superellum]|nr:MAG: hypothetical protein M1838_002272 [Thelocarpon superellum]